MTRRAWLSVWAACLLAGCSRATPTFNRDVAPIVFSNCVPCHRAGQPVPFTFADYSGTRRRAAAIADAVVDAHMPPWLPDNSSPKFEGERRLAATDVDAIRRWAAGGAPEGSAADRPPVPVYSTEWELGRPDLVVTMPAPYVLEAKAASVPGVSRDTYRNVILPLALPAARYVRAVEFRSEGAPVHHAVIRVDSGRRSRARDGADGQPGFGGMISTDVQDPEGHFIGWAPGRGPIVAPRGMPWRLEASTDLVIELHLLPGKTPVAVHPTVGLYFTDTPPVASPVLIVMGSKAIDIPAGANSYAIEDSYQLPVDARVLSVYPHAHHLGREMTVRALLPDGTAQTLIHIPRWSFHWQQDYRYVEPIALPRGTRLSMRYTYDNSTANQDNPSSPPRRVTIGPESSDEMGNLGIQLLPGSAADAAVLTRSFAAHAAEIDLAGAQMLARLQPDAAANHADAGIALARLGRFAEAIAPLERSVALDPASASTHNHLAGALLAAGRPADALAHAAEAARLAPRDAHLKYNYASMLAEEGDAVRARAAVEQALAVAPDLAEAHQLLGALLFAENRMPLALAHLRRAVELAPASASAHSDYGGALAAAGRRSEAAAEIRQALEIDPALPSALANRERLGAGR